MSSSQTYYLLLSLRLSRLITPSPFRFIYFGFIYFGFPKKIFFDLTQNLKAPYPSTMCHNTGLFIKELLKNTVRAFIARHEHDDPYRLSLKYDYIDGVPVRHIAGQIAARQTARYKMPDWYGKDGIIYPSRLSVEQCSSQLTAAYKARLVSGTVFADLTGGLGIDAFALAGSFETGHYVEQDKTLAALARHNFSVLGVNHLTVHHDSAEHFTATFADSPDCIYLDPARRDEHNKKVFRLAQCTPDITALLPALLRKTPRVLLKTSPMLDIDKAIQSLPGVEAVHVVAVNNECKEVLYLISCSGVSLIKIKATCFLKNGTEQQFEFDRLPLPQNPAEITYGEPSDFLYEPNAAVMKAGGFRQIGKRYGLLKLHPNTHLYTGSQLVADFPGRVFKITAVLPYTRKAICKALPDGKANITVRNFRDDVRSVRKKTGLRDGGDHYLFACTLKTGKAAVIKTHKVDPG